MCSSIVIIGAEDRKSVTSGMPSFISHTAVSNPMNTEADTIQSSRVSNFGVLEQYIGCRIGDSDNVSRSRMLNPTMNSLTVGPSLQSGAFNNSLASTNTNFSASFPGSLAAQSQKRLEPNMVFAPGSRHEIMVESNMVESSSHTETSPDVERDDKNRQFEKDQSAAVAVSDSSDKSKEQGLGQKTLRRLAQNREAARKSRLRKKAYVQQLESSSLKLTQLEQELQRARQQGVFISSTGDQSHAGSSNGTLAFDVEYARWVEEQKKQNKELRIAVNSHASDAELRNIVDNVTSHFNDIFRMKGNAAKADVFHILSGMWKTPAERCFMWIGGFRPSELLKLLVTHLEPLTEQQLTGIFNLQQSSHEAEDALSQGMEALQQSLAETLATDTSGPEGSSGNVANYMGQMAMAMGKLGTLEGFLQQADNLRQQTLQQMHRILTTRQSARSLLLINDYFSRLRALSVLWLAKPRE